MSASTEQNSILIVVFDMSADQHTARIVEKLAEQDPSLKFWGLGGPKMEAQNVELLTNLQNFAVIGIFEVLKQAPFIASLRKKVLEEVEKRKPKLAFLVDCGGFNISLAKTLRQRYPDLPILYFISPQVWASRPWRIDAMKETFTKMLVIFPFEENLYLKKGIPASFVGHPLTLSVPTLAIDATTAKTSFCAKHKLNPAQPLIAVFAGSRPREVRDHIPVIIDAIEWLLSERPALQFVISEANPLLAKEIEKRFTKSKLGHCIGQNIRLLDSAENHELMGAADLVWAKSGTTTLEVTLFSKPMLIFYRGLWMSYLMVMLFKTVKRIGWPNLLAGKLVVPELVQLDCRAEQFVKYTKDLLDVPGLRKEMSEQLSVLRSQLGQGNYAVNCANEILTMLNEKTAQKALS